MLNKSIFFMLFMLCLVSLTLCTYAQQGGADIQGSAVSPYKASDNTTDKNDEDKSRLYDKSMNNIKLDKDPNSDLVILPLEEDGAFVDAGNAAIDTTTDNAILDADTETK